MPGENWENMVLDFADAFKQLKVDAREAKHLGGKAVNGNFCYRVALFGVRSGPLVWGRTAAFVTRLTSAVVGPRARWQCFVDEPLVTLHGDQPTRDTSLLIIILLWLTLGCKLSWEKGTRGRAIEWIGAWFKPWRSHTGIPGFTLTITKDRIAKLAKMCDDILASEHIERVKVRQLAGLATWIAGIMPQLTAYTSRLWAATTTSGAVLPLSQVKTPIIWLRALCGEDLEPVQRHCRRPPAYFSLITFDASLTGGGATLQVGLNSLDQATTKPVVAYWHDSWTESDFKTVQVRPQDPGGQASLEALTLLISVATWIDVLKTSQGAVNVLGDALGILHNAMRFKAKHPVLNAVAGELATLVAPLGLDIRAAHIWSERNTICDELSRLQQGAPAQHPALCAACRVKRKPTPRKLLQTLTVFE